MPAAIDPMEELVERLLGGQLRQDGTSNAQHARRVRTLVMAAFKETGESHDNRTLECAALGHDLLEDSGISLDELAALAGEGAVPIIQELTNKDGDDHQGGYVAQMAAASEEARLVKYADLADNLFHASYQRGLGLEWLNSYFLPIVDPMREALRTTSFANYPKTGALLRATAELARVHLEESMHNMMQ